MAYLQGDGSSISPFVIVDFESFVNFITIDCTLGYYAELACDIDGGNKTISYSWSSVIPNFSIKLNGKKIVNFKMQGTGLSACFNYITLMQFSGGDIDFHVLNATVSNRSQTATFIDCKVNLFTSYGTNNVAKFIRCFVNNGGGSAISGTVNSYKYGSAMTNTINTTTFTDPFSPSNYSGLTPDLWVMDGSSFPRIKNQDVTQLTQAFCIKGITRVGGLAKSRTCRAHGNLDFNIISYVKSNASGEYLLNCGFYHDHAYVTHSDEYGSKFTPSKVYVIGEVIHPSIPNGYRYICTTGGAASASAPTEWPKSGNMMNGAAIFTPEPVYKPETFIAVPVLIDLLTGLPV